MYPHFPALSDLRGEAGVSLLQKHFEMQLPSYPIASVSGKLRKRAFAEIDDHIAAAGPAKIAKTKQKRRPLPLDLTAATDLGRHEAFLLRMNRELHDVMEMVEGDVWVVDEVRGEVMQFLCDEYGEKSGVIDLPQMPAKVEDVDMDEMHAKILKFLDEEGMLKVPP